MKKPMTIKKAKKILEQADYYISVITNNYDIRSGKKAQKYSTELSEAIKTLLQITK